MRRPWLGIVAVGVVLALVAAVLLVTNLAVQGQPPSATPRHATALAAATVASALPTPTATGRTAPTATATRAVPTATATRSAARTPTAAGRAGAPTPTPDGKLPTVAFAQLPREAQETIRLIDGGGPFPYDRDGIVFGNRERLLPLKPDGYYREYTVVTPGSADRGARRIVSGDAGELYYTDDHYESFRRVLR